MDYVELAITSGGFMAMDRPFLTNRLATLETEAAKLAYIMPPASVINAYFAEIYQKQGSEAAVAYFLDLATTFNSFSNQPSFDLEGRNEAPTFRFIRLNLLGKSFGLAFEQAGGRGLVFPEVADEQVTDDQIFELAQLFPQYVVRVEGQKISLSVPDFAAFGAPVPLDALTSQAENAHYIKVSALNTTDGLKHYQNITKNSINQQKMVQFSNRTFHFFIRKEA